MKRLLLLSCLFIASLIIIPEVGNSQQVFINDNKYDKYVEFGNDKIKMKLDYNGKANVSSMQLNGQKLVDDDEGIYTSIKLKDTGYSSLHVLSQPVININRNNLTISNISYGNKLSPIKETWKFAITDDTIRLLSQEMSQNLLLLKRLACL